MTCFRGSYLANAGASQFANFSSSAINKEAQWVIYPIGEAGQVAIKSVKDFNNLSIWTDKGPSSGLGWAFVNNTKSDASPGERFVLSAFPKKEGSYVLTSCLNQMNVQ